MRRNLSRTATGTARGAAKGWTAADEDFEWPPKTESLAGNIFELDDRSAEPDRAPVQTDAAAGADAQPETKVAQQSLAGIALVVFALIAILEGAFIAVTSVQRRADSPARHAQNSLLQGMLQRTVDPSSPSTPQKNTDEQSPSTPQKNTDEHRREPGDEPVTAAGQPGGPHVNSGGTLVTQGRLIVSTEPAGAQVSIDGRHSGATPLEWGNVSPGEHRIALKWEGIEVRHMVRVEPGSTVSVVAPLRPITPASGWIAISSPVDVDVFEDGALLGTSRSHQIMLPSGAHTLELINETIGYREKQHVRVQAGKVAPVSVTLPESIIHLNALPWAEVWIDGHSVGQTPIGNLRIPIGSHEIVFRHPELGEKTMSALVKAGGPIRATADLRQ
jgi:hypothetical protein